MASAVEWDPHYPASQEDEECELARRHGRGLLQSGLSGIAPAEMTGGEKVKFALTTAETVDTVVRTAVNQGLRSLPTNQLMRLVL